MATPQIQSPSATPADRATWRQGWIIVFLLFLIQIVNYADKTVVGLAASAIMAELGISKTQYGLVASSFFSLYAVGGLLVGFLVAPRVRPRIIIAVLLLIWSVTQVPIVIAASLPTLILCRTMLGFSEGAGTPTALNACHEWFNDRDRNMPTAFLLFGSTAGSLIAAPTLSYLMDAFGWRSAFVACGLAGCVVMILWLWIGRDGPFGQFAEPVPATRFRLPRLLWLDGTVLGILMVGFCAYWIVGFTVAWLPPFIGETLGFDLVTTGWLLSLVFAGQAALLLLISAITQRMMKAGLSSRVARGLVMALALLGGAICFAATAFTEHRVAVMVLMTLASGLPLVIFPLSSAMLSEIAPTRYRNQLTTVVFSAVTISALIAPALTGLLLQGTDGAGWRNALLLNASVAVAGAVAGLLLLRPDRSIQRLAPLC